MIYLEKLTFKEDFIGKTFEVSANGNVISSNLFTPDEYVHCCFYSKFLLHTAMQALKNFSNPEK